MDMKRFFLYFMVIAALALAGCGGNGGQTAMPDPDPDPDPDPPVTCTAPQVPNAAGTACVDPPPMPPSAELVAGIVTANDDDYSATNPAPYNQMGRPGKKTDTNGRDGAVVLLGSINTTTTPPNQNLERVDTDGTIGDVSIATVDTDGDGVETFTKQSKLKMTEDMALSVGRFASGSVHEKTDMGVTDTVYVYETRTAPGARFWNEQYETDNNNQRGVDQYDAISAIAAPTASTTTQKFNILTFVTTASGVEDSKDNFKSSKFPSAGLQTYTYYTPEGYDALAAKDRGATDIRGRTFDGMFHGVPGKYSCAGTTCTATTNNRGELVTLSGTGGDLAWKFTPNDLATDVTGHKVQDVVIDTDYLTFGYWVRKDVDEDETTIGVSTFASGTPLTSTYIAAMNFLEETAKYEGKAVGKFVKKTLSPDGMATISDGGGFTADANLEAHFGGNKISFDNKYTINGTINDFRNADGDMIDSNWSVTLGKANFATDYDPTATTPTKATPGAAFKGTTSAGGPAGAWGGSFYGTPMTSADTQDTPSATNTKAYPTSVAGEFDAHFTNGHVLGAFGATR